MYIRSSALISHQPTFRNEGFSSVLEEIGPKSELIHPDYNNYISAIERRRMSEVLKMSVACAKECIFSAGITRLDSIIVGTGMGCGAHTRNFIKTIHESEEGIISPTSFILSTHNTIAGQISILLDCDGYNMTHTQNNLSFEYSLIDAELNLLNGKKNVLVGAAEESDNELYNIRKKLNDENLNVTSGSAFFLLSNDRSPESRIQIRNVSVHGLTKEIFSPIHTFLINSNCDLSRIDLVLFSSSEKETESVLISIFSEDRICDFQKISGTYLVNSGFAVCMANDILRQGFFKDPNKEIKRILICNVLIPENLGLILMENEV